jgi:hypothetical protein
LINGPKRQKRVPGDIVRIDLGDGVHSYARVLSEAQFAIYDCKTERDLDRETIIASPILFYVAVMDYAVKRGLWTVVGHLPLEDALLSPPPRFMQDALNPTSFSIYENGSIRPAKRAECEDLERAAVWDPNHVIDRIRDHYAGVSNKWVESLKIK